ncbi:MAG TPA: class I SAM-dependent methyltransferase, partial [Bacteroidia bacterium]|nr:class I SAM-dependent methyltransferase [Bacteroidia bacterium]
YYGRAIYVSRHDYRKIFLNFLAVGVPLGVTGLLLDEPWFLYPAYGLACIGFALLFYSLFGLYRQYGHPAKNYFQKLLNKAEITGKVELADIHIGTYRHTYQFANLLPEATVHSIDCWQDGFSSEEAISDVRSLEPAPTHEARIKPVKVSNYEIPLNDASCDVVVFGFGTHEIPAGNERDKIFAEAKRILKPDGKIVMFEHGIDFQNYLIFGPVIYHVTQHKEWMKFFQSMFIEVKDDRLYAVDMIIARK